jgi:hypothetical protein
MKNKEKSTNYGKRNKQLAIIYLGTTKIIVNAKLSHTFSSISRSPYCIPHYNLIIWFMWVHKGNIIHMNNCNINFEGKFGNNIAMEFVDALKAIDFAHCHCLSCVFLVQ